MSEQERIADLETLVEKQESAMKYLRVSSEELLARVNGLKRDGDRLRAALKPFAESWNTDPTKRYPEHIQCLPISVWVEAREAYLETEDE